MVINKEGPPIALVTCDIDLLPGSDGRGEGFWWWGSSKISQDLVVGGGEIKGWVF